ncbi:hypothetical protein MFIFM68171_00742 [Madurella fahalii]|uniref:Uncharacterized protein n=1 Tax=Madurella fahalii TaxID=1157608 RepID=A0ABQ0FYE9_9PEZI
MQPTAALSLFSSIVVLFGKLAAAAPVVDSDPECHSQTICIDAINACGIRYGGCYDVCDVSAKPKPPPCPTTTTKKAPVTSTKPVTTKKPTKKPTSTKVIKTTTVKTVKPPSTTTSKRPVPTTSSTCRTDRTVCWDGINECGQTFGGCFPDCRPWPTFTAPPCSKTVIKTTITTRVVTSVTGPPVLTLPH